MFLIDSLSRTPVYEQIVTQIEKLILSDVLKNNDQLPSVRSLSAQLTVNPNTIQKAYTELDNRGLIVSVPGKGCFVKDDAKKTLMIQKEEELDKLAALVKEFKLAGISKEVIIECVERSFTDD